MYFRIKGSERVEDDEGMPVCEYPLGQRVVSAEGVDEARQRAELLLQREVDARRMAERGYSSGQFIAVVEEVVPVC